MADALGLGFIQKWRLYLLQPPCSITYVLKARRKKIVILLKLCVGGSFLNRHVIVDIAKPIMKVFFKKIKRLEAGEVLNQPLTQASFVTC